MTSQMLNISSLITLTGRSERTIWRWIADGTLARAESSAERDKTMVQLDSVKPYIAIPLEEKDFDLLINADRGDAEAQNDLALLFLSAGKPEGAIYWFNLAAGQNYADAMNWLALCHMKGDGVPQDENVGMMWLAKAAAHGHVISQEQMQAMRTKILSK